MGPTYHLIAPLQISDVEPVPSPRNSPYVLQVRPLALEGGAEATPEVEAKADIRPKKVVRFTEISV